MKTQHTPTPWNLPIMETGQQKASIFDDIEQLIAITYQPFYRRGNEPESPDRYLKNAQFIVQACNCHEELLAACKAALKEMQAFRAYWTGPNMNLARSKAKAEELCETAIAKAQE